MRNKIERYAFFWNVEANEGHILFHYADGSTGQALLDSAGEGLLLLDVLRNEKPVYYDEDNDIIMTGMEMVGEEENND